MKNIILASLAYAAINTGIPTHAEQIQTDTQEKITTFLIKPQYPYDKQGNIDVKKLDDSIFYTQCIGNYDTSQCREDLSYQTSRSFPQVNIEEICKGDMLCAQDLAIFLDSDILIHNPKFKEGLNEEHIEIIAKAFIAGWNYPTSEKEKDAQKGRESDNYSSKISNSYECNQKYPCADQKIFISKLTKHFFEEGKKIRIKKYQLPADEVDTLPRDLFETGRKPKTKIKAPKK